MKLSQQLVCITGANRGIGWALAEELAKQSCRLVLAVRDTSQIDEEKIEGLKRKGAPEVFTIKLDLTDNLAIQKFPEQCLSQFGLPDVLINNAGQLTGGLLEEQQPKQIEQMFQVNLVGLVLLTQSFLPLWLERKKPFKIINNASVSGFMYFPCASTYAASKAGVVAFTESLRQELKSTLGTTLLLVTPGIKTRMYDKISEDYGKNLKLDFLSAMRPNTWATMVVNAIQADNEFLFPTGPNWLGVKFAHHFPGLFAKIVSTRFKR